MFIKWLAAAFVILFPTCLSAQEHYFAMKGGYNYSSLQVADGTSQYDLTARHAMNIAMVYATKFENLPFGLSIEPGYTLKGSRIAHDTLNYKFHYLSIPVLFDFYPLEKIKISAGPELSYLMAARNLNDTITTSLMDTYSRRWELSGTVGVSISPTFFLDIGMRYNMAFTYAAREDELLQARNLYNNYLQIYILLKIAN